MVEATIDQDALSSSARHKLKILLSPLAEELHQLFVNAKEIVIISPWIKSEALQEVLGCNRDQWPQIRALMSANLKDFLSGTSDIEAVKWLLEAEAELRSVTNLHAKVYLADGTRAIVTSANLTSSGLGLSGDTRGNVEVGVLVDDPDAISTLTATVQEWLSQGRIIDDNWLRKMRAAIDSIPSKEATQRLQEAEAALQEASVDLAGPIFEMQQANERVSEKTEQSPLDGIVEFRESDEIYEIEPPSTCREPRRIYRILKRGREKLRYAPQRCPRCGEMLKGDQLWNHLFYLCPKAPIKRR